MCVGQAVAAAQGLFCPVWHVCGTQHWSGRAQTSVSTGSEGTLQDHAANGRAQTVAFRKPGERPGKQMGDFSLAASRK